MQEQDRRYSFGTSHATAAADRTVIAETDSSVSHWPVVTHMTASPATAVTRAASHFLDGLTVTAPAAPRTHGPGSRQ